MKRIITIFATVALIAVIAVSTFCLINNTSAASPSGDGKPFYVGVTYCGDNVTDAKLLVDKVANYTNLFVLQSGPLMTDNSSVNEIGDYAVAKRLHFAMFYDTSQVPSWAGWLGNATQRWGDMFSGVYYADEPAGKLLDTEVTLIAPGGTTITKLPDGTFQSSYNDSQGTYSPDGTITVQKSNSSSAHMQPFEDSPDTVLDTQITYYPDGSITLLDTFIRNFIPFASNFYTLENGSSRIAQEETYQQAQSHDPIPSVNEAAELFINKTSTPLDDFSSQWQLNNRTFPVFTSDYGLYWWDYKCGYDMVLAELGWNVSVNEEIGLARGAATLEHKDWGTIITWKYMQEPYLPDGNELYDELSTSYKDGATYTLIFNYAPNMTGPYGTLQQEHFDALQRFWTDVVQNPNGGHGSVKAEAAFILPENYGWGMRNPQDKVWGIWQPFGNYSQIWPNLQGALGKYGDKLDIVYNDKDYPAAGKYSQIIDANSSPSPFSSWVLAAFVGVMLAVVLAVLVVVRRLRKKNPT